jgi:hypothetical protein
MESAPSQSASAAPFATNMKYESAWYNNDNACTMSEEQNLRDCLAQRNILTGICSQNQRQPFERISGWTRQWPSILHPGSVANRELHDKGQ